MVMVAFKMCHDTTTEKNPLPPGQSGLGAILQGANEFHTNLLSQAPEDSQTAEM